jgi:ribosomal protein L13
VDHQGGVGNAVVLLRPLGAKVFAPEVALTLDNRRCAFTPHVQVGAVGSELLLKNSDPILIRCTRVWAEKRYSTSVYPGGGK